MLREWIQDDFAPVNRDEVKAAMRQVMQQVALAGLYRAGFFDHAAFYGGTALRIFYGLPRYSEDLDFSLLRPDTDFSLSRYVQALEDECRSLGITVEARAKQKTVVNHIDAAFIHTTSRVQELLLHADGRPGSKETISVKIKLEVDVNPPLDFDTEERLLLKPFSCYIKCMRPEDLMAGKLHAVLFRRWKNRVKGRDWFDLEWYIRRGISVNLTHFTSRAVHSGDWSGKEPITRSILMDMLTQRVAEVDIEQAKADVRRFLTDTSVLDIWSVRYFTDLVQQVKGVSVT